MTFESCIPVIPSVNLEKSLRLWVDGLGFENGELPSPENFSY